jgi:hypothetical protein
MLLGITSTPRPKKKKKKKKGLQNRARYGTIVHENYIKYPQRALPPWCPTTRRRQPVLTLLLVTSTAAVVTVGNHLLSKPTVPAI